MAFSPISHNNNCVFMSSVKPSQRILGIDPGFGRVGFGVIEGSGHAWKSIDYGCIETQPSSDFLSRLETIHKEITKILGRHHPTHAAVEQLFFAKNAKTAIQVGEARGTILLTLQQAGLPIFEYTPLQVKQAVTGYGKADKKQIQDMVRLTLHLPKMPLQDDAADALAVALTCGVSLTFFEKTNKSS